MKHQRDMQLAQFKFVSDRQGHVNTMREASKKSSIRARATAEPMEGGDMGGPEISYLTPGEEAMVAGVVDLVVALMLMLMVGARRMLRRAWLLALIKNPSPQPSACTYIVCDGVFLVSVVLVNLPWCCGGKAACWVGLGKPV
jgi:hypothetical protein